MDNLINLAEYRQALEQKELDTEVDHLRALLAGIMEALPPRPMEPMAVPLEDALGPFTRMHTDLSGYDDDTT